MQEEPRLDKTKVKIIRLEDLNKDTWFTKVHDFFYYDIWCRKVKDTYNNLKQRFIRRQHIVYTELNPWDWHEPSERVLYAVMAVFMDFYENDITDWRESAEFQKINETVQEIHKWWKNYPNRLKEIDELTNKWYIDFIQSKKAETDEERNRRFDLIYKMEKDIVSEEQEILKKVIDIRGYMWS
jgi:hypothetical protein